MSSACDIYISVNSFPSFTQKYRGVTNILVSVDKMRVSQIRLTPIVSTISYKGRTADELHDCAVSESSIYHFIVCNTPRKHRLPTFVNCIIHTYVFWFRGQRRLFVCFCVHKCVISSRTALWLIYYIYWWIK